MDPGAHICLAGERKQPTEDDTHEQQRNKQASCTRRLSGRPRPTLPVQALQVLHPWIPRHALCSGHCSLATTTHAAVPGGTHRILTSGPQGSKLSAGCLGACFPPVAGREQFTSAVRNRRIPCHSIRLPSGWVQHRDGALHPSPMRPECVPHVLASATRLLETGGSRGLSSSVSTLTTDCSMSGVIPDPLGVERKCRSPAVATGPQPEKRGATRVTAELDGATPAGRLLWSAQANVHLNRRQHEQAHAS